MRNSLFRSSLPLFLVVVLSLSALYGCGSSRECDEDPGQAAASAAPVKERYVLTVIRSVTGPTLVRTDTSTCRMWRMRLNADKWTAIAPETRSPGEGLPVKAGRFLVSEVRSKYGPMLLCNDVENGFVHRMPMSGEEGWKQLTESTNDMSKLDRIPLSRHSTVESAEPSAQSEPPAASSADEDLTIMRETIEDESLPPMMRVFAAEQLGNIRSEGTLPALIQALGDSDPAVVVAAVWALKLNGDPHAIPALEKLTLHEDTEVRSAAQQVIEALRE
jgi:hypothetical protein